MSRYVPVGKAAKVLKALRTTRPEDPLDSPMMKRFTKRVVALRGKLVHDSAAILIRLGCVLEEVLERYDYHTYRRWLRSLSISITTSKRWRAVYRFARRRPQFLARVRDVGGIKLWRLASIDPKEARRLLRTIGVEGIEGMKTGAFLKLTAPHVLITPNGHPSRRAQGLVNKLHQWRIEIEGADVRRLAQPEIRRRLHQEAHGLKVALGRLELGLRRATGS